jgi:hypothetical protein
MANKFTRFLTGVGTGLTNPKGIVSNWQHGTRLFIDDTYRLSPRTKFLFYVNFEIDKSVVKSPNFNDRHANEVGLLVKTSDLPKYNFETTTKNQYNRKKIIYKNFNYDPITITLHDDSAGIVNALWALYYGYYVADRANPTLAFDYKSQYRSVNIENLNKFRYGLDNNITAPFFSKINLYTMSRRRFLGYTLVNPKIKSWNHGNVDYSAGSETVESQMTVEYESVIYSGGNVSFGNPKGFATLHYDTLPSPLSVAGGGVANLFGEGGVLDGLEQIFGDVSGGTAFGSPGGFLSTAIKTINTYKNIQGLSKESIKQETINILSNPQNISTVVGGIAGVVFPKPSADESSTSARQKVIIPPTN